MDVACVVCVCVCVVLAEFEFEFEFELERQNALQNFLPGNHGNPVGTAEHWAR